MLDHFLMAMRRAALQTLRRSFSFKGLVEVAPDLNLRTIKRDWNVADRQDWSDDFIVTCVRDRLYGAAAPWVTTSRDEAIARWLDDDVDSPQARFTAAMTTLYLTMLELPETLPRWQVHVAAASAIRPAEDPSGLDVAPGTGSADQKLASELAVLRSDFFENTVEQWTSPLTVVLAEMERRPRPGVTVRTIVSLLHRLLDGFILWKLMAGDGTCGGEDERFVGLATLALVEGLTEPDRASPDIAASDDAPPDAANVRHWIRDMAAEITADLYRGHGSNDHASPAALDRGAVLECLTSTVPTLDRRDLEDAFDQEYPEMSALRDAALRMRLTSRVGAAMEMRDERPEDVLRQVTATVVKTTTTDTALVRACRLDRVDGKPSYLTDVEHLLTDLLCTIGADDARDVASTLLDRALDGDSRTVKTVLALTIRNAAEETTGRRPAPGRPDALDRHSSL